MTKTMGFISHFIGITMEPLGKVTPGFSLQSCNPNDRKCVHDLCPLLLSSYRSTAFKTIRILSHLLQMALALVTSIIQVPTVSL